MEVRPCSGYRLSLITLALPIVCWDSHAQKLRSLRPVAAKQMYGSTMVMLLTSHDSISGNEELIDKTGPKQVTLRILRYGNWKLKTPFYQSVANFAADVGETAVTIMSACDTRS